MTEVKWTDEAIYKAISEVMMTLGIDRMPTQSETKKATGASNLKMAIVRRGGFTFWAEKLGLPILKTKTIYCEDCGCEMIVSVHCGVSKRCLICRKAHKAQLQKERNAELKMTKPMDGTTDIIIVRAMWGKRKQSAAACAEDLGRSKRSVQKRAKMLRDTGRGDKIWAMLDWQDKNHEMLKWG